MNINGISIKLAGIIKESIVNGPGFRFVLFSQGCLHNCKGCFNPETHSFTSGELYDINTILNEIKQNPLLKGITCSGGDPFEQADKFAYIAQSVHKFGLDVWTYTGYTFEYIMDNINNRVGWIEFINEIDVLVDGKFEEENKSLMLKFKGSSNQRIIDVQRTLKNGSIVEVDL